MNPDADITRDQGDEWFEGDGDTWVDCPHAGYDKAEGGCPACEAIVSAAGKCPDRIWLQIEDDGEVIPSDGERTFCKDKINDSDVEYVRADRRAGLVEKQE